MKLPRDISGARAVKPFERLGFKTSQKKRSHIRVIFGPRRVTVPLHDALAPKTLQSIVSQAGLEMPEFLKAFR